MKDIFNNVICTIAAVLTIMGVFLGILYYIKWSVEQGDPLITALVIIAAFFVGFGIAMWAALKWRTTEIEAQQQSFINNARENMMMMQQQAKAMQAMFQAQQAQQKILIDQPKTDDGYPALLPMTGDVVDAPFTISGFENEWEEETHD